MPPEINEGSEGQAVPGALKKRRVVAILLPRLLSEVHTGSHQKLSFEQKQKPRPQGVVLVDSRSESSAEGGVRPTDRLDSVCLRCHRAGVRPGQTIAEARALVSDIQVEIVEKAEVEARLVAVAEVVQRYGMTISWSFPDVVWVDVTGVAHLFGGEEELAMEIHEQVRLLGHATRVCLATGPRLARAIAQYGGKPCRVVLPEQMAQVLEDLPLLALPLSLEKVQFLNRVGLFTVGQLRALPKETASARLGENALLILSLVDGVDPAPLTPGEFPRSLVEELSWEDPAYGIEPLLFALRGILAKLGARLRGRGEACSRIELCLTHDSAIARHRGVLSHTLLEFELSSPLQSEGDWERVLKSRLARLSLQAPTVGLRLVAAQLSPQLMDQMGLVETGLSAAGQGGVTAWSAGEKRHQEFPVLLAELEADVGKEGLGVLSLSNNLRPEARSVLNPIAPHKKNKSRSIQLHPNQPRPPRKTPQSSKRTASRKGGSMQSRALQEKAIQMGCPSLDRVTRLFARAKPIPAPLSCGTSFGVGSVLYTIEKIRFLQRLEGVEWWTPASTSRDYYWAWLTSPGGGTEALLYFDRHTRESFLQALGD